MDTIRTFFPKLGHFFRLSKKGRRGIIFLTEFIYTLFTKTSLSFIYRRDNNRFSLVQQFLSCLTRITSRQFIFHQESVPLLKLSTASPQGKSSHTWKSMLTWLIRIFHMLVEETLSPITYVTEWTCKTSARLVKRLAFFVNNFPVSSP